MKPQVLFVPGREGRLFTIYHAHPARPPAYRVLVVPPFGEELNKSRRLLALTSRRLCALGCDVLTTDLYGTGDSEGAFRDGSWHTWLADLETAYQWLAARAPDTVPVALAVRAGALLLAGLIESAPSAFGRVVLWQPVLKGEQFLGQFLRLRVMASRFAGIDESQADLLETLEAGGTVEVGGYEMTTAMAWALRAATADGLQRLERCRVDVIECRGGPRPGVSAPTRGLVEGLNAHGIEARHMAVAADAFWATQEITAPDDVAACTASLLFPERTERAP